MGAVTPNQVINLLGIGKPYTGGNKFYIGSGLVEVGEEELKKREDKFIKTMEELKEGINRLADTSDFVKEVGKDEGGLED
ncbi:hypothetical protein ES705_47948 [subsurface metagenome]